MQLNVQRRIAGDILKCSPRRVKFDTERLSEVKEAITKFDIWALIKQGIIHKQQIRTGSRGRARALHTQKVSGRSRGHGSRKGRSGARTPHKREWMNRIRNQRELLKSLKDNEKIEGKDYRDVYQKAKGGFFRSRRHVKLYLEEHNLIKK